MDENKKRYRWWVIGMLFAGTFVNAVDRGSMGVATPSIMKELALDPAMMGVILSAFFWSYFAGNIPSGALADKFGAKTTLGWAAFIWSFLSALTGAAQNFIQLVACRIGVGAGESALQPCNVKVVKSVFPTEERATAIGIFNAGIRTRAFRCADSDGVSDYCLELADCFLRYRHRQFGLGCHLVLFL